MIYPSLPAPLDLGFVRLNGAGLGNCLYVYFHAYALALRDGQRLIAPAWASIPINEKLRGIRKYHRMLRKHPDEIGGIAKALALATRSFGARFWKPTPAAPELPPPSDRLTIVASDEYSFAGLHPYRTHIRQRLVEITTGATAVAWGAGGYIAVHVRLGDFVTVSGDELFSGERQCLRVPLSWYAEVIGKLQAMHPELAVHVFSDGSEEELAPLLSIPGVSARREPNDVLDLLALAGASVLVGSHSTFSRWAAFLGDMPTIWLDQERRQEEFGSDPGRAQHIAITTDDLRDPLMPARC